MLQLIKWYYAVNMKVDKVRLYVVIISSTKMPGQNVPVATGTFKSKN